MKISVNPKALPSPDQPARFPALVQSKNGQAVLLFLDPTKALVLKAPPHSNWMGGAVTTDAATHWRDGAYIPFHGSVTFEAP
jgi:hypothetical protein